MTLISLRTFYTKLSAVFFNLLSPPACAYCKSFLSQRDIFCSNCAQLLQPVVTISMPITSTKSVEIFAACAYQEPIKSLVIAKSWGDIIASTILAELIWQRTPIQTLHYDYLVPVPLHWTRFAKRGFNQCQEIAQVLSSKGGKKVVHILKRNLRTPFQSGLNPQQRLANVQDAFVLKNINKQDYKDKHLIIIDDLFTTGATIRAVAKKLLELKPASIKVVVASRVI